MARRQRIDSAAAAVAVASAAARPIASPAHVPLDERDLPFFDSVIEEFARSEWTRHQVELAALLARTMADMAAEQKLLRDEGGVAFSERGTPVVNPRKALVQMHAGTILSMRRSLSLHARAQGGEAGRIGERRAVAKDIEAGVAGAELDDLIPGRAVN
jgi:hypothetical protein